MSNLPDSASPGGRSRGVARLLAALEILRDLPGDMELQRAIILLMVSRHQRGMRMQAIAERLDISAAACSRNAHHLGGYTTTGAPGLGLVEVVVDSDDHRERWVRLTARGRAFIARLEEACQ